MQLTTISRQLFESKEAAYSSDIISRSKAHPFYYTGSSSLSLPLIHILFGFDLVNRLVLDRFVAKLEHLDPRGRGLWAVGASLFPRRPPSPDPTTPNAGVGVHQTALTSLFVQRPLSPVGKSQPRGLWLRT